MLIVDRGSREPEVKEELEGICSTISRNYPGMYSYTTYCFLEVVPPFIEDGISNCIASGADFITIIPYFLYPGMKLKDSVKKAASISRSKDVRVAIAKPLSKNTKMVEVILRRVHETKREFSLQLYDFECDLLLIGHGSSDRRAREAFDYMVDLLRPNFRSVRFCFLELDEPDIMEGIRGSLAALPKCLLIVPYFLHKGAHIKYDIVREIGTSIREQNPTNMYLTEHLGADGQLVDIVLDRAMEVERGILSQT
jgi:precorrin-8X/cobalt-precorrin-8 methylmutase